MPGGLAPGPLALRAATPYTASMRVTSDIYARALMRRAQNAGAFATLARRGAAEAGVIHVLVDDLDGNLTLYGPSIAWREREPEGLDDRRFAPVLATRERAEVEARLTREASFDPDFWVVEVEDREGRSFIDPDALVEE